LKQTISRMQFLSGDFRGGENALRPPWAVEEALFIELCSGCGDCIQCCPTSILVKARAGFPAVDFRHGECEFCGQCAALCKTGALQSSLDTRDAPWALKALIGERCITYQGVICRCCTEGCETQAIRFQLTAGCVPQPQLVETDCTGCGACVAACPVDAISVGVSA